MSNVTISSGVSSSNLYVNHLETLTVASGGFVSHTDVEGQEVISNGGSAVGDVINGGFLGSGGVQSVMGFADDTVLHSGATQSAGGVASGTIVDSGGLLVVVAGGKVIGATAEEFGSVIVSKGGVISRAIVRTLDFDVGGDFLPGGAAVDAIVDGGAVTVESGGSVTGTVLRGDLFLSSGGVASDSIVVGGVLDVYGGSENGARIRSGAGLRVVSGAATGDVVESGGELAFEGGSADDLTVESAGLVDIGSGLSLANLTLRGGAHLAVDATSAKATLSDGMLTIAAGGSTYATATLANDGNGLSFTVVSHSTGFTEFVVSSAGSAAKAPFLAQVIAAMPNGGTLAGSAVSTINVANASSPVLAPSERS